MEKELNNTTTVVGNYNDIPTSIKSYVSIVTMISGLTVVKVADKQNWADGDLKYTITVTNSAEKPYTSPKITDIIDTSLVEFIPNSVYINSTLATEDEYNFDDASSTLTINLKDIAVSTSTVVEFKVRKKE